MEEKICTTFIMQIENIFDAIQKAIRHLNLLKKERNTMRDFASSNALWNEAVRLTVRNHAELMQEQILSQKEWSLFCLSLGMDHSVFRVDSFAT